MYFNKQLIEEIKINNLDVAESLLFAYAVEFQDYGLLDTIINSQIITPMNEPLYRINLCTHDIENGRLKLKYPLFVNSNNEGFFLEYLSLLGKNGMKTRGHTNNEVQYAVLTNDESTQANFYKLSKSISEHRGTFDLQRLVDKTIDYYSNVQMPVKLDKFLSTYAYIAYTTEDDERKSRMI
jgi:hypothetical protein